MNHQATRNRRGIKDFYWLALAAVLPLAGCALSTAENRFSGWRRPLQSPAVSSPARDMAARAANPVTPPATAANSVAAHGNAGDAHSVAVAPRAPRIETVAFAGIETVPRGVLHANAADFEGQVLRSDVPVLVDFYASWCGPCKALAPTLEEVAVESPRAKVVKVNIDDSPELAARYGVNSVPSLMVFKDGRLVARHEGVVGKTRLKTMLDL